jgi:UDP-N-acetylglucosamine 2-epimerase (non-hydrolysing)
MGELSIPEEVNRLLTDHISDCLFTTSKYDDDNLIKEGIPKSKIHRVGNIMVDCLMMCRESAQKSDILNRLGLDSGQYALLTLHRPTNVDNKEKLELILSRVKKVADRIPVVFPAHPRTQKNLNAVGHDLSHHVIAPNHVVAPNHVIASAAKQSNLLITTPLGYCDMLNLEMNSRFVITDSGGIQVETTALGIPCLSVMDYPVWRITHEQGTNILVGSHCQKLLQEAAKILDQQSRITNRKALKRPELWDGNAAEKIVKIVAGSV